MRIMLLGTDRTLFTQGSAVRERLIRLAHTLDALDSIVFSTRAHGVARAEELAPHMHAHPTNSFSRFLYGWDATRIARRLPRPDVVSAQDPFETGLAALCIARHFGVPLVVEMHTDFLSPSFARHSILNRIRVLIAEFVLRRAAGGYAVSERIRERVHARYGSTLPLYLVPIYVDVRRFAEIVHAQHPRFSTALLWVGRMEPEKDPMLALNALSHARKKGLDAGITFVGSGQLAESLKACVRHLGLDEYVEFAGLVSDVRPYYAQADLLLVTSEYEGYGMTIVEALAAGVPVLSTDVGIAREAGAIIAGGDYSAALIGWLSGLHERGVLKLQPYMSEETYFSQVRECYEAMVREARR